MRARMLQDGNLPGGDAPTRRELLRRLELMSAARPRDVLLMERHGPQAGATKRRVPDWWRNAGIALRFRAPAWCGGGRFTIPVAAIHYDLSHQLLLDAEAFLSGVSPPAHAKPFWLAAEVTLVRQSLLRTSPKRVKKWQVHSAALRSLLLLLFLRLL